MTTAQAATVARLARKGWRAGWVSGGHVPMYLDRPCEGFPQPCQVHIDRRGGIYRDRLRRRNFRYRDSATLHPCKED